MGEALEKAEARGFLRRTSVRYEFTDNGTMVIKVMDARTDKLVRTIPPEEQLAFARGTGTVLRAADRPAGLTHPGREARGGGARTMPIGSVSFGSGLASGIDFNAIIEAVLSAERRPLTLLQSRVDGFNRTKSALGNLDSLLTEFQSKLQALKDGQTVGGKTTTLSVTDAPLKAQAGGVAASGTYDLEVLETAAAHRVRSAGLVDAYSPLVSDGTITIQAAGHEAITIDVSAAGGNNSLKAIADAVNAADEGVQASVIFDGTNSMLVVKSKETGTQHALTISDSTNLNLDDPANVLQAARDAQLVVDGVTINAQTNTVSDAIEGVTLTLTGKTDGPLTLTVADDIDGTKKSIKELVDAYNKVNDFFQAQYGSAEAEKSSAVASASSLRTIQRRLQGLLTESVTGVADGAISSLALLGIEVADGTGRLKFDETKFKDLVDEGRYDEIRSLLLSTGSASDASDPLRRLDRRDRGGHLRRDGHARRRAGGGRGERGGGRGRPRRRRDADGHAQRRTAATSRSPRATRSTRS